MDLLSVFFHTLLSGFGHSIVIFLIVFFLWIFLAEMIITKAVWLFSESRLTAHQIDYAVPNKNEIFIIFDMDIQRMNKLKVWLFIRMAFFQSFGDLDCLLIRHQDFYPPFFHLFQFSHFTNMRICTFLWFKLSSS